jgi:hypothetical protein
MLGDITKRGFVVAEALMIDLEELWEFQTAVAKDERQIDPPTLAKELDGQLRESPRTVTSWDDSDQVAGKIRSCTENGRCERLQKVSTSRSSD